MVSSRCANEPFERGCVNSDWPDTNSREERLDMVDVAVPASGVRMWELWDTFDLVVVEEPAGIK